MYRIEQDCGEPSPNVSVRWLNDCDTFGNGTVIILYLLTIP